MRARVLARLGVFAVLGWGRVFAMLRWRRVFAMLGWGRVFAMFGGRRVFLRAFAWLGACGEGRAAEQRKKRGCGGSAEVLRAHEAISRPRTRDAA